MRGGEEKTWRGEKKGAELDEKERRQIGGVWGEEERRESLWKDKRR